MSEISLPTDAIERVAIESLSLMPREIVPIVHTQRDLEVVGQMLRENGQRLPVLAQKKTGRVFFGGDVWIHMKATGAKEINAILCDVDDREAARIAIRLRRSIELADWSEKDLAEILAQMEDFDELGFTEEEFTELMDSVAPPSTKPRAEDPGGKLDAQLEYLRGKWKTEVGQLWEIPSLSSPGKAHRLIIGDSTDREQVRRLMNSKRARLFATDPPYLVDYTGDDRPVPGRNWSTTYHDFDSSAQADEGLYDGFMNAAISEAIAEDAPWYCWHASKRQRFLEECWERHGVMLHQQIVWVKTRPVLTHSFYLWAHEPCLFGWVKGHKPENVGDNTTTTVWNAPNPHGSSENVHPTSKPTVLFEIPMLHHTKPGDVCYEPFSGSGSQLVAGEKLGRLVYGLELSSFYVAGILERISEMGCEPKLIEAEPSA